MRSIDASLRSALATGSVDMFARVKVYVSGALYSTLPCLSYSLTGLELDLVVTGLIPSSNSPDSIKLVLERGVNAQGSEFTLATGKFSPTTGSVIIDSSGEFITTRIKAHSVPSIFISFAGDVSYQSAITSFCTAIGKTAVFKNPGLAVWTQQFLPAGKTYSANNARAFLTFIRQKYLLFACDNGNEELLFYYALDLPATQADINPSIYKADVGFFQRRRFLARDENSTVRYAGNAADPIHNLGFIKSTDSLPSRYVQNSPCDLILPINLEYQDGDCFNVDASNFYMYPAQVTEGFDKKWSPAWQVHIGQLIYFASTEGGALPSTIEASAPYTPLNVSTFNKILDTTDNNIQAAIQTIDDHNHTLALGNAVHHGDLTGLSDDDHTQYARKAGDTFTNKVTIASGGLDVSSGNIRSSTPSLADDNVSSFTPSRTSGFIFLAHIGTSGIYGIIAYNTATPSCTVCIAHASVAVFNVPLYGTTGTDGCVNVSCYSDGKIYIENRLGGSRTFSVLLV